MVLEKRSSLRRLISEFSSFESGSVCEVSLSAETAGFTAESPDAVGSASEAGPGLDVGNTPAVNTVFVAAVFVVPSPDDSAPADPNPEGPASADPNSEGPASADPNPEGPASADPNPEGPAAVVSNPEGPAVIVPDPEGPVEVVT